MIKSIFAIKRYLSTSPIKLGSSVDPNHKENQKYTQGIPTQKRGIYGIDFTLFSYYEAKVEWKLV